MLDLCRVPLDVDAQWQLMDVVFENLRVLKIKSGFLGISRWMKGNLRDKWSLLRKEKDLAFYFHVLKRRWEDPSQETRAARFERV